MLNNLSIMGRLTADPELMNTASGISVTNFSIAVERNYLEKDNEKRQSDFFNVVAWRGTAELICKHFTKGKSIIVQGYLQTRNYEDKNGTKKYITEIVAEHVFFAGDKQKIALIPSSENEYDNYPFND